MEILPYCLFYWQIFQFLSSVTAALTHPTHILLPESFDFDSVSPAIETGKNILSLTNVAAKDIQIYLSKSG